MAPSAGSTMTMRSSGKKQANGVGSAANGGPVTEKSQNESGPRDETDAKHRDFFWTYTEEPHRTRRLAIIKAHPEVTKLCGPEPLTKYVVLFVVSLQLSIAYLLRSTPFWSIRFWAVAYVVGATANQNLFLAIHEISHNLAFRSPTLNRLFAVFANLPIGLPYSAAFRPYHLTHHKSLGVDGLDTDLPTALEAALLDSVLGKAFFCTFQIIFYAVRPMVVFRVPFTWVSWVNLVVQLGFDYLLVTLLADGSNGGGPNLTPLLYLFLSSFLAGSLHPLAGHFIAEHYVYDPPKDLRQPSDVPIPETFSYYGPLNFLTYNVGLHNEHHDFPAIPWTRLPKLHEIASEFYDNLPQHTSWSYALWRFIWDDNVGIYSRVKRKEGGRMVGGGTSSRKQQMQETHEEWKDEEIQA